MNTVIVWMLIVSSGGYRESDTVTVVGHFADFAECQRVGGLIPTFNRSVFKMRCVQARVVK